MPRLPVHTVDDAPEASKETLTSLQKRMGRVLNIHGSMAHSPALLGAYAGLNAGLATNGTFDARTREAIALAVGNADSCDYCQAAHTAGATAAGMSVADTVAIRSGEVDDPKLRSLLTLLRSAATKVGEVDDALWDQALAAGWSDTELGEAFAHLVANLFTNYFNHFNHTELDFPEAPPLS